MKKFISVFMSVLMVLMTFCGCNSEVAPEKEDGPIKTLELDEGGIVTKDYFEYSKKNGTLLYVRGKSGDFEYQWAVFGNRITEPKDFDMTALVEKESEGNYRIEFFEETDYMPSFSLKLRDACGYDDAVIYDESGNSLCSATLTEYADHTDVNFYVNSDMKKVKLVLSVLEESTAEVVSSDNRISGGSNKDNSVGTSDYLTNGSMGGSSTSGKDKYNTDPVPEGKPQPVEPENQELGTDTLYCTFSISCATILNNMDICDVEKRELVPSDGWILKSVKVAFTEGESVFDVLRRVCRENGIHMESEWTPMYNSAYIEGINNLYEFDVGNLSGWMYKVNEWFPNYGCSRYVLKDGDVVFWCYTCDLGYDVGGGYAVGG